MRRVRIVPFISLIIAFAFFANADTSYAASLTGTLVQPVKQVASSVTNAVPVQADTPSTSTNPVTTVTEPVTDVLSSPTAVVQSLPSHTNGSSTTSTESQPTATTPTGTASTATGARTAGSPSSSRTVLRSTAAQSAALANGQSIGGTGRSDYGTGQISQAMATMLYRGAAVVSIVGFILYAATSIRHNRIAIRSRNTKAAQ